MVLVNARYFFFAHGFIEHVAQEAGVAGDFLGWALVSTEGGWSRGRSRGAVVSISLRMVRARFRKAEAGKI